MGGGVSFALVSILTGDGYIGVEEKIKIGLYGDNGGVVLLLLLLLLLSRFSRVRLGATP